MAVELPHSRAATVAPLLAAVPQDQSFIRAAVRGAKTRLLVDDAGQCSVVLLWPERGDVVFLAGERALREGALADVVRLLLSMRPDAAAGMRLALSYPQWSGALFAAFGHAFAPRGRRSYTLAEHGAGPKPPAPIVPQGYEVRPMDESLARDAARADPEIDAYWPDPREFAERGAGFCAVESSTGRVASAAWSVFDATDLVEIAVGTVPEHRGRGLAPATAHVLVRHCLANGLEPRWSTDFDNVPSRRVAAKVGFGNVVEHDWPLYTPFNAHRRSIDVPDELTRAYHGRYAGSGTAIRIDHDGYALRFYDQLGQTLTLAAETETRFFLREVPIQLAFTRGPDGSVDGLTREQGGKQWRMERVPGEEEEDHASA